MHTAEHPTDDGPVTVRPEGDHPPLYRLPRPPASIRVQARRDAWNGGR